MIILNDVRKGVVHYFVIGSDTNKLTFSICYPCRIIFFAFVTIKHTKGRIKHFTNVYTDLGTFFIPVQNKTLA